MKSDVAIRPLCSLGQQHEFRITHTEHPPAGLVTQRRAGIHQASLIDLIKRQAGWGRKYDCVTQVTRNHRDLTYSAR